MSSDPSPCSRSAELRAGVARLAGITAKCGRDSERAQTARRDYHVLALAEQMRRVTTEVGPLTAAHRDQLAAVLWSGASERPEVA